MLLGYLHWAQLLCSLSVEMLLEVDTNSKLVQLEVDIAIRQLEVDNDSASYELSFNRFFSIPHHLQIYIW
ncbi:hypothetical protein KC19_11G117100 [Ceratodon purpureus]|uniref:Uncharacterized protein n=1 Tax=Ceratodon purpureus TaxID=3225 RepID=A0A8T0GHP4_CERPU|nr:hypothetical protein KC19_11G117100 [Ceratodon purpureus]